MLRRDGMLAMIEPGMSPVAYLFYRYLHQEPADISVASFAGTAAKASRDPFDANQAILTLLFEDANRLRLNELVPELRVRQVDWLSLFGFPLSGGFKPWCLIPPQLALALVKVENRLPSNIRRFFGFRILTSLEKAMRLPSRMENCVRLPR
jgi:hypothetical protein